MQEVEQRRSSCRGDFMKALARKLRKDPTDAERELWQYLREHRMAGFKFRRQFVIEPYIVDFVCLEARLIIEADGGQHLEQLVDDRARTEFLESLGYKVMRFWNNDILGDTHAVLDSIYEYLNNIPSPGGRGSKTGDSQTD